LTVYHKKSTTSRIKVYCLLNYYIFNNQQKIIWSGIYGNDRIDVIGLSEVTYLEKANSIDSVDYEEVYVKQSQWASGVLLKSIWSKIFILM